MSSRETPIGRLGFRGQNKSNQRLYLCRLGVPRFVLGQTHGETAAAPALVTFRERSDSRDSLATQQEREAGGGHFIRARAKQNNLPVPGNDFVRFLELRGINMQ